MANINISQALTSQSYAKKCWINYYYQNNSMGITAAQIGEIAGTWSDCLGSWKTYAETDHTRYDIDDSDYQDAINSGIEDAKSYNKGSKGGQITRTTADGIVAVGGNLGKIYAKDAIQKKHLNNVEAKARTEYQNTHPETLEEMGAPTEDEFANNAKAGDQWNVGLLIACAFDVATAAMYRISKPNKAQKEAVDAYAQNMGELQASTCTTQDDLAAMDEELINLNDNASITADDANVSMADAKTLYQFHADTIEYFEKAKVAGHEFTQDEVEAYQESIKYMTELNEEVGTTQDEAETTVREIYDEMGEYEDGFDEAAENIGNVEGFTAEAEKVDESTQTQCYIEGAAQGINALGAAKDGYEAISYGMSTAVETWGATAAYIVAGGLAAAAGVSDGFASAEQFKWASETGQEIDVRKATQELNAGTQQIYEENNDYYQGYVENVEALSVIVPDDMEVPTAEIPEATESERGNNPSRKKKPNGQ